MKKDSIVETKTSLLESAGSFWRNGLIPSDLPMVRKLARVSDTVDLLNFPERIAAKLAGEQWEDVNNVTIDIRNKTHVFLAEWNKRLQGEVTPMRPVHDGITTASTIFYTGGSPDVVLFDSGLPMSFPYDHGTNWAEIPSVEPMYYIVLDKVVPFAIRTAEGVMVSGIDFFIYFDRLILKEDPKVIFPADQMFVVAGKKRTIDINSYVHGVQDLEQSGHFISKYLRGQNSATVLELALNEAASHVVFPDKFEIHDVTRLNEKGTLYTSKDGKDILVTQRHTEKSKGESFERYEVPNKAVECHCLSKDGDLWWRKIKLSPQFELRGVTGQYDVVFYDRDLTLERSGDFVYIEAWGTDVIVWNYQRSHLEFVTSSTLSSALIDEYELVDGGSVTVSGFEFVMQKLFSSTGLVVTIREDRILPQYRKTLYDFLEENKPTGAVVLINKWQE